MSTIRIALPGYNAKTETNIDRFSLYADSDNILIKEKARGTFSLASGSTQTIAHNLGHIPDFKAYVNDQYSWSGRYGWKNIPAQNSAFMVGEYWAEANTSNLYITNNVGSTAQFAYHIFYDNQVGASAVSVPLPENTFAVAKSGKNATSSDPNDFIYRADLNTFKILKQGATNVTYTSNGVYSINHGVSLSNPASYDVFVKFPDGYTVKAAGNAYVNSRDFNWAISDPVLTTTQVKINIERYGGSATNIVVYYFIYEAPLTGSLGVSFTRADQSLMVAKAGVNASTSNNPNDYSFLSGYNTLKYHLSGNTSINIVGDGSYKSTETSITHNLGYIPYFTTFVDDFINFPNARYALAPFSSNTFTLYRQSESYADSTKLYFRMINQSSSNYTARFYYKVYRNRLDI